MFLEKLKNLFFGRSSSKTSQDPQRSGLKIFSPMSGRVVLLSHVPDPTFAKKVIGDGIAILPTQNQVVSPINGVVTKLFRTKHACVIENQMEEVEILIHIGIDSVKLQGEGFTALIQEGAKVQVGTPLIECDLQLLQAQGISLISPLILSKQMPQFLLKPMVEENCDVEAGICPLLSLEKREQSEE